MSLLWFASPMLIWAILTRRRMQCANLLNAHQPFVSISRTLCLGSGHGNLLQRFKRKLQGMWCRIHPCQLTLEDNIVIWGINDALLLSLSNRSFKCARNQACYKHGKESLCLWRAITSLQWKVKCRNTLVEHVGDKHIIRTISNHPQNLP